MSDNELGLFLRTRREAVTPAQVGLPTGPRRRTPGLRRAELAMLAGVSVEYVTRLEQGRDRRPSPAVLSALADALQLSPAERVHLAVLSKWAHGGANCLGNAQPLREVRPTVRAILDHLEPAPAVVINHVTEVLAYTDGYRRLMAPAGLFAGPDTPADLARFVFCHPEAPTFYMDWEFVADQMVARLKDGPFRADAHIAALADELTVCVGAAFDQRLDTVPSLAAASGITRLAHPEAGPLRLAYEVFDLSVDDGQQLIVHLPADDATAAALDTLAGRRSGSLRAVPS
ncbi:helix-turn-helix transcriptional regulator [Nocardia sp. CNY236]|uniref:helix-turn-helix transcriptional regulator n=1 Tax=Nocardia sp. CNY236 TaxID=1169152 RepID=UPI00041D502C|nr:helix-turn-helix transcriptional regulator [Nocardia sp. CNY236]